MIVEKFLGAGCREASGGSDYLGEGRNDDAEYK